MERKRVQPSSPARPWIRRRNALDLPSCRLGGPPTLCCHTTRPSPPCCARSGLALHEPMATSSSSPPRGRRGSPWPCSDAPAVGSCTADVGERDEFERERRGARMGVVEGRGGEGRGGGREGRATVRRGSRPVRRGRVGRGWGEGAAQRGVRV